MICRGDIYMADLEPSVGHEQRGHRPVLVVSFNEFHHKTKLPVILPITTGGHFARRLGYAVELSGTRTAGIIRCDQPRVLDLVARKARFVERVPEDVLFRALAKAVTIFE